VRHFCVGTRRRAERSVVLVCREGLRDIRPLICVLWMSGKANQTTGIRRAHELSCPPPSCGELGRLPDGGGLDVRAYKIGRFSAQRTSRSGASPDRCGIGLGREYGV
jgi:hypothetical protein